MNTHNIQFHDKIKKIFLVFWSYRKNFIGTQKRVRSHSKRAIGFRAIAVERNPSLAEHDMPCLSKLCRSRSVGF